MFESTNTKYLWPASYPGLLMLSLILGLMGSVALVTFCIHNAFQIAIGIIAGALALFYNQNIAGINLRSKKGYKPFTIAMVSIITAVLIPVFKKPIVEIDFQLLAFYAIAQWFFISAMCIAADMRDLEEDRQDHIKTFPVSAGLNISKKIIYLLLSIQIALMVLLYACSYINIQQFEVFILSSLLSILLVFQLNTLQSYYFFVLAIDGLILSQAFGLLILS